DDLVSNDGNGKTDVFIRDTLAGTTTLISVNCPGTASGNGHSYFWDYDYQHLSTDGRYVTFHSDASDLAAGDYPSTDNVFRRDLLTGTTVLVSQNRFVTGSGNDGSWEATISTNGNVIGFASSATDLVALDLNLTDDVFTWTATGVVASPDLVLDKSASVGSVVECDNLTYTITVTNSGATGATGVSVTDTLPSGMTFVSASASQGSVTNSGGAVTASLGSLGIGAGASVTITATATAVGSITNTASATSSAADATPANNTDSVTVTVTPLTSPTLNVALTNSTQVFISWPSATPNVFTVQTTTNLQPVIVWTTLTNAVSNDGTNRSVLITPLVTEPERFYRLKK
ncbi:MAG: DUF11 domain-containing protein, partial [Verrucomicrobia bacterium]